MAIFDKAKIPAASIDVSHPNAIFFGASNYASGIVGGKAAGEYAKANWDCKDVWVFMGENLEEGEAADLRLVGFADGVQEVFLRLLKFERNQVFWPFDEVVDLVVGWVLDDQSVVQVQVIVELEHVHGALVDHVGLT